MMSDKDVKLWPLGGLLRLKWTHVGLTLFPSLRSAVSLKKSAGPVLTTQTQVTGVQGKGLGEATVRQDISLRDCCIIIAQAYLYDF